MAKSVFVFGSNEAGMHGGGAARTAYEKHGARWGKSYGLHGDSFAIPTKDVDLMPLPLARIDRYVLGFIAFAEGLPKRRFIVTRIGCGLAGFTDEQIAPMFKDAPSNCEFDEKWAPWMFNMKYSHTFWGTF